MDEGTSEGIDVSAEPKVASRAVLSTPTMRPVA